MSPVCIGATCSSWGLRSTSNNVKKAMGLVRHLIPQRIAIWRVVVASVCRSKLR